MEPPVSDPSANGTSRAATAAAARTLAGSGTLFVPAFAAGAGGAALALGPQAPTLWDAERRLRAAMEAVFRALWAESERAGHPGELLSAAYTAAFRPLAAALLSRGV